MYIKITKKEIPHYTRLKPAATKKPDKSANTGRTSPAATILST